MSLLTQIRDLAADNTVPLETVLLKCMVLADILGDETLMHWLAQELDGYKRRSDVPDYRIVGGQAEAKLTNGFRYETVDISRIALSKDAPKDSYDRLNTIYFTDGVKELEVIQGRDDLVRALDGNLKYFIEENTRAAGGYRVREAYIPIAPGAVAGVLSSIRSRVLQYVFRLRKEYPEFDEHPTSSNAPSQAALTQLFQFTIGQGSAVAFGGGSAFAQSIGQQVIAENLESLKMYLGNLGVEDADLRALDAVLVEAKPEDLDDARSPVRRWIETVVEKASAGGKEIAKTATREIIQAAVKYFFGIATGVGG